MQCWRFQLVELDMTYTPEQFAAANKANVEALASLSSQAFGSFEKLVELNLATSKAALTESFTQVQAALGVKNPQELLALQAAAVQPAVESLSPMAVICTASPAAPALNSPKLSKARPLKCKRP